MKTHHEALQCCTQAKAVHMPIKAGKWGTKDVIATSVSPVVLPIAVLLVIHKGDSRSQPGVHTGRAGAAAVRGVQAPAVHSCLPSFLPHKIQARSVPSCPLPSPNSCFSKMQGNIIWTQRPDTLMSSVMFPQLFQIWVKQPSPVPSKTPLFL